MKAALVALILELSPRGGAHREVHAEILAAQIQHAARRNHVDGLLLAALVGHESSFVATKRGKLGELGLGQILRGTLAAKGAEDMSDETMMLPPINLALTAAHMRRVQRKCGDATPAQWLSVYAGNRWCRPSHYSRAIVATWERLKAFEAPGPMRDYVARDAAFAERAP